MVNQQNNKEEKKAQDPFLIQILWKQSVVLWKMLIDTQENVTVFEIQTLKNQNQLWNTQAATVQNKCIVPISYPP